MPTPEQRIRIAEAELALQQPPTPSKPSFLKNLGQSAIRAGGMGLKTLGGLQSILGGIPMEPFDIARQAGQEMTAKGQELMGTGKTPEQQQLDQTVGQGMAGNLPSAFGANLVARFLFPNTLQTASEIKSPSEALARAPELLFDPITNLIGTGIFKKGGQLLAEGLGIKKTAEETAYIAQQAAERVAAVKAERIQRGIARGEKFTAARQEQALRVQEVEQTNRETINSIDKELSDISEQLQSNQAKIPAKSGNFVLEQGELQPTKGQQRTSQMALGAPAQRPTVVARSLQDLKAAIAEKEVATGQPFAKESVSPEMVSAMKETGAMSKSDIAKAKFGLSPQERKSLLSRQRALLIQKTQLEKGIQPPPSALTPEEVAAQQAEAVPINPAATERISSEEIDALARMRQAGTMGKMSAAKAAVGGNIFKTPAGILKFFESAVDQLPLAAHNQQLGRQYLITQTAANETDKNIAGIFKGLNTPVMSENKQTQMLSDYQRFGFGPEMSAKYTADELKPLQWAASATEYLGGKAAQRGFLDTFRENYFLQQWVVPKAIREQFQSLMRQPDFVTRLFPRSIDRVFPDIESGLKFFREQAAVTGNNAWLKVKPVSDIGLLTREYFRQYAKTAALRGAAENALDVPVNALGDKLAVRLPSGAIEPEGYVAMSPKAFGPGFFAHKDFAPFFDDISRITQPGLLTRKFFQLSYLVKRLKLIGDFVFHSINVGGRAAYILPRAMFKNEFYRGLGMGDDIVKTGIKDGLLPIHNLKSAIDLNQQWSQIYNTEASLLDGRVAAGFRAVKGFGGKALNLPSNIMFGAIEHFQVGVYALEKQRLLSKFIKPGMGAEEIARQTALAGRAAADHANTIAGSFATSAMAPHLRKIARGFLLSPTWTASQIDQHLQMIGKSPLMAGLPNSVKVEVAKMAWKSWAAGVAAPFIGLEMLNHHINGNFTWDEKHGNKGHFFDLKLKDGSYLRTPIGFFANQLYGYAIQGEDVIAKAIRNRPTELNSIKDLKVFGKLNPVVGEFGDALYSQLRGETNLPGKLLDATISLFTPIGLDQAYSQGGTKTALKALAGVTTYPPQFGGSAYHLLRGVSDVEKLVGRDVFKNERKFIQKNDINGLIQYLSDIPKPTDIQSTMLMLAKMSKLKNIPTELRREKQPITRWINTFGRDKLPLIMQHFDSDEQRQIMEDMAKEGGQ